LQNVARETINNQELRRCTAMDSKGNCKRCGCSWANHMHIYYKSTQKFVKKVDTNIQQQINEKKLSNDTIANFINGLRDRQRKYTFEKEEITKACATFACFLKSNAIRPYNDAVKDYLDYLIANQ